MVSIVNVRNYSDWLIINKSNLDRFTIMRVAFKERYEKKWYINNSINNTIIQILEKSIVLIL